ncbi:hypothetical protein KUTeg_012158 [Tegillarca granosa]|uniref:Methyltransferase domain-containing protein n=1 Tax=Tegillarca granosa TaxID=220873 RepID=A0ABQ9EYR9_TEGGR|nr:hypothetical protein KUTeg_012158 [Tegillarca granosa]
MPIGRHWTKLFVFCRYIPPEQDTNCVSIIPKELTGVSKEAAILIPKDETLQGYNNSVLACLYHRYVQTLQRHCTRPARIGDYLPGGWNVCTDPDAIPVSPCVVFTFSDERKYDAFSTEIGKDFNCTVYYYHPHSKLGTDDGLTIDKFQSLLKVKSQKINVLNIDINDREWDVVPKLVKSGILGKTEQLSVRFHSTANTTAQGHIKRLLVLRELYEIGFRIYWNDRDTKCILQNFKKVTGCYYVNMIRIMNRPSPVVIPKEPEFSQLEPREYGELFNRYIYSVQIPCKEIVRIGNIPDGGWDVCHDAIIANDFSFDDDMAKTYGCKIFAYDPSMRKPDHRHSKNVMFYATGISDKNGQRGSWRMRTFETMMEETGHKGKIVDFMKMDVESSEWGSVPQMISSGVMKNIRQFAFEIHTPRIVDDTNPWYKGKLPFFRDLYDQGFRIFWSHANPFCVYRGKDGKSRAMCFEIYFININKSRGVCKSDYRSRVKPWKVISFLHHSLSFENSKFFFLNIIEKIPILSGNEISVKPRLKVVDRNIAEIRVINNLFAIKSLVVILNMFIFKDEFVSKSYLKYLQNHYSRQECENNS